MMYRALFFSGVLVSLCLATPLHAAPQHFEQWLEQFRHQAREQGIGQDTLDRALADLTEDELVVRLDRKQPEGKITLTQYLKNTVTPRRIRLGRELLAEHRDALERISAEYGVPPHYILALWGIETDFGRIQGDFSVIRSLATLAYEGRRRNFFSHELVQALKILERESMTPEELTGSWAGAMGHCQFMPSTYLAHAADGDGDGRRDIWRSEMDTFASIANYLHHLGWNPSLGWGGAAKTPPRYHPAHSAINRGKSAKEWRKRGFSFKKGDNALFKTNATLYAIYPGSKEQGVFLVTENYKALLQWNRSRYFATAVGTLADAIGE